MAGGLTGVAGQVVPFTARVAVGTLLFLALTAAPLLARDRLLQVNRETEQNLLSKGPFTWALANGFLLGLGFTSRIGYWIWYLIPLGCFVLGSPAHGAVIWGTYGCTRLGIAVVVASMMHRRPSRMSELSRRLLGLRPTVRRLSSPVTTILAATLALWLGL